MRIDRDAVRLHGREDRHQRQLDVFVQAQLLAMQQAVAQHRRESEGGVGVGCRIARDLQAEILVRGFVELGVRARGIEQVRRDHRVVDETRGRIEAARAKHREQPLRVVRRELRVSAQQRREGRAHARHVERAEREREARFGACAQAQFVAA